MNLRSAAGRLGAGLMTLLVVTGCNNCTGSVCGNQNTGNAVKDQTADSGATPRQKIAPRPAPVTPSADDQPPTKAEYIKAADAICQKWTRQAEKHTTSDAELSWELFTTLIRLATNMADEWHAMTPPVGDTGQADVFIEKQYADVARLTRMRDLWASGDTDGAQVELEQATSEEAIAERRASARAYGFRVCD
ncbi:hypothetical protein [Streptomyces sp. NRRL S-118]|uniref:hypothetical protein n=1 Tax=Streptomyces sp. NRRL S-118 TaxID=1463881 RepID=UPI0004C82BE4|nr:hypothetical protein [Streptomyces sp. NRRL S-118]